MKKLLHEASQLLKTGHTTVETDPLFTKMTISRAVNLIDQALFVQESRNKAERALEQLWETMNIDDFSL